MDTYELDTCTKEEFEAVKTKMISDFIQQITGAEVDNQLLGHGYITSCLNTCNTLESLVVTVHYDLDETKHYGLAVALSTGGLKLADESLVALLDSFMAEQNKLKATYNKSADEARRREREAEKKTKQKEAQAKKKAETKKKKDTEEDSE